MSPDRASLLHSADSVHLQLPPKQRMRGRVGKQPGKNIMRRRQQRTFADRISVATGGTMAETSVRPLSPPRRPRAASEAANEALAGLFLGSSAKAPHYPHSCSTTCIMLARARQRGRALLPHARRATLHAPAALDTRARFRAAFSCKRLLRLAVRMRLPVVGVKCHEQNSTRHGNFARACVCNAGVLKKNI